MSGPRGGVVLRVDGKLYFLPAEVTRRLSPVPPIARVAGAPPDLVGIAFSEGAVVPVVSVGEPRSVMIVCEHGGELVGLLGADVEATGIFERDGDEAIRYQGGRVESLSLAWIESLGRPSRIPARRGVP